MLRKWLSPYPEITHSEISITRYYIRQVAEEIQEMLQELGEVSIYELVKRFNFTGEFLTNLISRYLGNNTPEIPLSEIIF